MDPKYGDVLSYREDADGNHWDRDGNLLSTAAQRAAHVPEWRLFELGRLEELDGKIVAGPSALPEDVEKYGPYRHQQGQPMSGRKKDWNVITGWEKRIKVDFGSIGPNHVRWSDWSYKERDIVARKVHEITLISDADGNRSKRADEWRKENEPIVVGFARDGKPMPDWAHADYRPSGVPEYVTVVWKRENSDDVSSKGDWAYEPPAPWKDKGEEPAWSAPPVATNLVDTRVDKPAPPPAEAEKAPIKTKPTKIMPDDPNHTPLEKALNWASETHHGAGHQTRWNCVAAALGADNGHPAMSLDEVERQYQKYRNPRWTIARDAIREVVAVEDPAPVSAPEGGEWRLTPVGPYGTEPPPKGSTGWYTRQIKWLPDWYYDLPEMTLDEAQAQKITSRANVAPRRYIFHKMAVGIIGRQKLSDERTDLPIWTMAEAAEYYRRRGIKMRSVCWLDGHLMTRKGYSDTGTNRGEPIARAADEEYEASHQTVAVPSEMAPAIKAGDWPTVAKLAGEM